MHANDSDRLKRLGLKRFRIKHNEIGAIQSTVLAKSAEHAWRKFCTQRFGRLKPDPSQYVIIVE